MNANNLFEIPALFSMMPDLKGKRVLDLGCCFREHCKRFIEYGAKKVIGIDISEKMLEVAMAENSDYPDYKDLFHKPDFLLVKVKK